MGGGAKCVAVYFQEKLLREERLSVRTRLESRQGTCLNSITFGVIWGRGVCFMEKIFTEATIANFTLQMARNGVSNRRWFHLKSRGCTASQQTRTGKDSQPHGARSGSPSTYPTLPLQPPSPGQPCPPPCFNHGGISQKIPASRPTTRCWFSKSVPHDAMQCTSLEMALHHTWWPQCNFIRILIQIRKVGNNENYCTIACILRIQIVLSRKYHCQEQ